MGSGVSYVVAFGGGVASFISPCVLPVVPAYLSMITGLDLSANEARPRTQLVHIARDTALFVAGFGAVFVAIGLSATALGSTLFHNRLTLTRVSGGVVVAMALFLAGSLVVRAPFLYREMRFHPSAARLGPFAAPVIGAAFGFGWYPCLGPVLASVTAIAASERGLGQGAVLLGIYALGLGVPFLAVGLGLGRLSGAIGFLRRRSREITLASAVLLAFFGVLLVLNKMTWVTTELESGLSAIGLGGLLRSG